MPSVSSPLINSPWSLWKTNWRGVLATAAIAAGLEAGTLSLFLYMLIQDGNRLLLVVGGSLLIFCFFHVGVSALYAHLISHSAPFRASSRLHSDGTPKKAEYHRSPLQM